MMWSFCLDEYKSHTLATAWGKFTSTLQDAARLTLLSLSGESNPIRVVLEGEVHIKLKYNCRDYCFEDIGKV